MMRSFRRMAGAALALLAVATLTAFRPAVAGRLPLTAPLVSHFTVAGALLGTAGTLTAVLPAAPAARWTPVPIRATLAGQPVAGLAIRVSGAPGQAQVRPGVVTTNTRGEATVLVRGPRPGALALFWVPPRLLPGLTPGTPPAR